MSTINKYTVNKYFSSLVTWCHMCHVTVTVINGKVDQIRNSILTDSNYTRPWSPGRRLKKIDLNQDCYLPNQKAPFSSAQDSVQTCIKIHISIVTSFYYILYTYNIYILPYIFPIYRPANADICSWDSNAHFGTKSFNDPTYRWLRKGEIMFHDPCGRKRAIRGLWWPIDTTKL